MRLGHVRAALLAAGMSCLGAGCNASPPTYDEQIRNGSQELRLAARLVGGG